MIVDWGSHCKWAALLKSSNTTVADGMNNGWCESRRLLIYDGLWLMNAEDHGSSGHMSNIESAAVHWMTGMTQIFIFPHRSTSIHHYQLVFVSFVKLVS